MDLSIAEIPYQDGTIRFRYSRYLSQAGDRYIRHGPFFAYHENGALASRGDYAHGAEQGEWQDFHPNGQPAAQGRYEAGEKTGEWQYWRADGTRED